MTEFQNTLLIVVYPVLLLFLFWRVIDLSRRVEKLERGKDEQA